MAPRPRFCGCRTGAARAASEDVRADDKVLTCVQDAPWPYHRVPPPSAPVSFGGASRGVRVSGQRVDEQYGIVGGVVELAPGLVREGDILQASPEFGLEEAYAVGT